MTKQRGPLSWFTDQTKSLYIARPDTSLNELIFKHPDKSIPRGAKLTVRASECAIFFREGRCIGRIDPGTVALDTANIPFLGHLIVDPLTAGNHFLCELFFVSRNETTLRVPRDDGNRVEATAHEAGPSLARGQYRDIGSDNVVNIRGSLSYTIKALDPIKLLIGLAGQSIDASREVEQVLAGRLLSLLRQVVGQRLRTSPVLDVVSNVDAESMSNELREVCRKEFGELGVEVGRMFNLTLSLDEPSSAELRRFGKQRSELMLAKDDAFVQANVVMGQRAAMQGLASGLASGGGPLIMSGNIGGAFQPPAGYGTRGPVTRAPAGSGGTVLSGQTSFLIVGDAGLSGPYSARQLALTVLSKGQFLEQVVVRRTDDPSDVTFPANLEPSIVAEFQRRAPAQRSAAQSAATPGPAAAPQPQPQTANAITQALDAALLASVVEGVLSATAIAVLARTAVGLGLVPNEAAGEAVVLAGAARLGVRTGG